MLFENSTQANLVSFDAVLPNSNWVENTEKENFQCSPQSHWAKLKKNHLISAVAKLHYEKPMKDCKRIAEQAQNWSSAVIYITTRIMGINEDNCRHC
uniref:Uncharacterized protein n=1 Tax=Cannabis sativa TaxID=3483 RepID=A0A803PWW2_CANSA